MGFHCYLSLDLTFMTRECKIAWNLDWILHFLKSSFEYYRTEKLRKEDKKI
uniref:Uncharacterized protein n=1 Tax=Rhizophora mucronata TaxID=61149 RepID=A0A2P2L237_RHIMU